MPMPMHAPLIQVHTRKGNPVSIKDLKNVSVDKAATVIVMVPTVTAQDELMKTVLSQAQVGTNFSGWHAHVQIQKCNQIQNLNILAAISQVASAAIAVTSLTAEAGRGGEQSLVLQNPPGHEVRGIRICTLHAMTGPPNSNRQPRLSSSQNNVTGTFLSSAEAALGTASNASGQNGSVQVLKLSKNDFSQRCD